MIIQLQTLQLVKGAFSFLQLYQSIFFTEISSFMPQSHYRRYACTLWLDVLLDGGTTSQNASYFPRFGVSIITGDIICGYRHWLKCPCPATTV